MNKSTNQQTNKSTSARLEAYKTLCKIEKDNSYSNLSLSADVDLDEREGALYRHLVRVVLERKITLDYNISLYLNQSIKRMKPQVLTILRMGAAQILFMDKIPSSAAVNESVKLCQRTGSSFAKGMVNAVLRKVAQNGLVLPEEADETQTLSVKYSFSKFLTDKYLSTYGRELTEKIMASSLENTSIYIRKNNLKSNKLTFEVEPVEAVDGAYKVCDSSFTKSRDLSRGLFHVQDLSSQLCVAALDPKPGETVCDVCAAPGGKTATIAERMNNTGVVYAYDIYPGRVKLIEDNVKRLGLEIVKCCVRDAATDESLPDCDRVLCDVPCSGTGDAGRKPEIKYKSPEEFECLPKLQLQILENSARAVKSGGILVYSTCTLVKDENDDVVDKFLANNNNFEIVEKRTIFPFEMKCDGFFYCKMRRTQ